ncbi:uridylate kinase, putative [Candidatus Nitrososphaera evergladensis SR1]|uniref:Uridylate kinase n=1 Tax=Candidatus Nitrososphaera evergladensis SR1 TaxID=1459636 RepID=A0A075MPP3_9ARCH|nr:UMP kinase [Candidatus Nitrososphaera evergladensis]AIF83100.1 uridylate kinase, putative [Candidatus Nitrososphaera evergladensis SR1]
MVVLDKSRRVVIKLSGKVFSGEDGSEIKRYASMLANLSSSAKVQPVVVAGGGRVARHYINIARGFGLDEASLDIMGIEVSRLNAKLLIAALGEKAYPAVPEDLEQVTEAAASGKIVVAGGLHPGQSTNATSALIAEKVGAARFVNATDVDGIYDSDPRKNKGARHYSEITTKQCRDLLSGESSMAGGYDLMDIVALKVIERSKIPTVVIKSEPEVIRDVVLKNKAAGTKIIVGA